MSNLAILRSLALAVRGRICCCALITLALIGSMIPVARAQEFRVKGTVRDSSGASMADAQIELHAGSYTTSTTPDSAGEFAFEHVPEGSGTVVVNARGF